MSAHVLPAVVPDGAPAALSRALAHCAPVSLNTLTAEAALLTRVDRKYLLRLDGACALLSAVDARTRVLEQDGARGFAYESVYFDTADRLSYQLAARGRRRRFKLRSRTYLGTRTSFLEMKTRGGRGVTVKERIPYAATARDRLTPEGREYSAGALVGIGLDPSLVTELRAALTTRYRRTTLLAPDGSRATIDTDLTWVDADGRALELPGWVVVETKSADRPSALDRALWRSGTRPQSLSKFGTGTAALHPELTSNKWSRLLRGPFATATGTGTSAHTATDANTDPHFHHAPHSMKDSA